MPKGRLVKTLFIEERRVGLPLVDLIWLAGGLVTGHYVVTSILFGFIYSAEKLLIHLRSFKGQPCQHIF